MSVPSSPPKSLLVVRLGAMGDIIHTLPAVAAVRNAFPGMHIGWVVEKRWAELLCAPDADLAGPLIPSRPLVDSVHLVDTKSWRKSLLSGETRREISTALREVQDQKYEMAIDFQGALKSAVIAKAAKARTIVGMERPRESPARLLYDRRIAIQGNHVVEQYHSLAEGALGRTLECRDAQLPCHSDSEQRVNDLVAANSRIALLNPGAGWGAKQWPAERYGEVAAWLAGQGFMAFINFGPGEQELAELAIESSRGKARPLSCSLSELIASTRRAQLFIGGDTGPLHLASALRVPVVAIFGPTDPARNGPYGTGNIVLRDTASRTSLSHTNARDPGLHNISSEQVIRAACELLEKSSA